MEKLKAKFIQSYTNVPENLRRDTIVILNKKPYSWDTVYYEVKNKTPLGEELLKKLNEIGLLE